MPVGVIHTTRAFLERLRREAPSDEDHIHTVVRAEIAYGFNIPPTNVESRWIVCESAQNGVDLNVDIEFSYDPNDPNRFTLNDIEVIEFHLLHKLELCADMRGWRTVSVSPKPSYQGRFTMSEFEDGKLVRTVGSNREAVTRTNVTRTKEKITRSQE
ncbi:MAG: hypothetical protein A3F33_02875 [Candidatus Woykebacteria bacterium RIFCSPHIGHO2_12_FULL_43_10]|uniref:Uncharacterized protein n=2 Tax=Candidatus Woykeibacteriota TaxID=1817899 RepID=A0A1G1WXF8_9BACT|nr:MAG: hypothetical protein A2802_01500 [Candidatus Woykebacteria bacterium RIFCSPHIGHO2_01_FULL_43_29]OGY28692.1 MAG: hypothetical protein A3J50_01080 [Candidatus Woykebacteria bacterium RIFCSPHIGHO2_02_FULL_43_16b]OGY29767.1 MAG: hypothetical protein A3F33_02875 [Candidatus Woykebacteria bacterium RIFCSPHIGHO2_12_FULL_43_10]OGY32442.1 MAG: hypothetical protein A3A61_00605 [Candidatus Woykebacteria bacterium RIFCSPLOWO2_01_FULL_43_14]